MDARPTVLDSVRQAVARGSEDLTWGQSSAYCGPRRETAQIGLEPTPNVGAFIIRIGFL